MAGKKAFGELQFKDSFMFAAAMEDEEICRGVLERILEIPIKKVRIRTEATLLVNPDYRGVRLVGIAGAICTRTWETDYWVPRDRGRAGRRDIQSVLEYKRQE